MKNRIKLIKKRNHTFILMTVLIKLKLCDYYLLSITHFHTTFGTLNSDVVHNFRIENTRIENRKILVYLI